MAESTAPVLDPEQRFLTARAQLADAIPAQEIIGPRNTAGAWLEYLVARAALGSLGRLPEGLLRGVLGGLARFAKRVDTRHTEAARGFLSQAFPDESAEALPSPESLKGKVLSNCMEAPVGSGNVSPLSYSMRSISWPWCRSTGRSR